MPDISVCCISYNGGTRLKNCLRSIVEMTSKDIDFEVVFLDDGSRHEELRKEALDCFEAFKEKVPMKFIQNETNLGITKSWNKVTKEASSPIIALLNDDILVTKNWLRAGLYFMQNNPDAGMCGFPTFFCKRDEMKEFFRGEVGWLRPRNSAGSKSHIDTAEVDKALSMEDYSRTPGRCACPVGCGFLYKKEDWEKIKYTDGSTGFPEWITSLYEDFTFAYEMMKMGKRNYMLRFPYLYHCLGNTFTNNPELRSDLLLSESRKKFIDYYGGDERKILDGSYEEFKKKEKEIKVKYLDSELKEREEKEEK